MPSQGAGRAPFLRGAGALAPVAPGAPADLRAAGEPARAAEEAVAGRLAAPGDAAGRAPLVPAGLGPAAAALPSGFATGAVRRLGGEVSTAGGGLTTGLAASASAAAAAAAASAANAGAAAASTASASASAAGATAAGAGPPTVAWAGSGSAKVWLDNVLRVAWPLARAW